MSLSKEQRDLILAIGAYIALECKSYGGEWVDPANNQDDRFLVDLCRIDQPGSVGVDYIKAHSVLLGLIRAVASGK